MSYEFVNISKYSLQSSLQAEKVEWPREEASFVMRDSCRLGKPEEGFKKSSHYEVYFLRE